MQAGWRRLRAVGPAAAAAAACALSAAPALGRGEHEAGVTCWPIGCPTWRAPADAITAHGRMVTALIDSAWEGGASRGGRDTLQRLQQQDAAVNAPGRVLEALRTIGGTQDVRDAAANAAADVKAALRRQYQRRDLYEAVLARAAQLPASAPLDSSRDEQRYAQQAVRRFRDEGGAHLGAHAKAELAGILALIDAKARAYSTTRPRWGKDTDAHAAAQQEHRREQLAADIITLRRYAAGILQYPSWFHRRNAETLHAAPGEDTAAAVLNFLRMAGERQTTAGAPVCNGAGAAAHPLQHFEQYFEEATLVQRSMALLEALYGIRIVPLTTEHCSNTSSEARAHADAGRVPVWAPDVLAFAVWDAADGGDKLLGTFFLSPHERLPVNRRLADGFAAPQHAQLPSTIVAATLKPQRPLAGATLFIHELGHAMHHIIARPTLAAHASYDMASDMVEVPSIAVEQATFDPRVLVFLSGDKLPVERAGACAVACRAAQPRLQERLRRATLDAALHSLPALPLPPGFSFAAAAAAGADAEVPAAADDPRRVAADALAALAVGAPHGSATPAGDRTGIHGAHPLAHVDHIFRYGWDYDALTHQYVTGTLVGELVWREMVADVRDAPPAGASNPPVNSAAGLRFRRLVLERGSQEPPFEILRDFFGDRNWRDRLT